MGCRQSSNTESPQVENKSSAKYRAKIDPRILQKYEIQGNVFYFKHTLRSNLTALIGQGAFSSVLRVAHRATGQKYAIKMIEKLSPESRESCDKELRVLRRTRHQNIIQLIEIYEGMIKILVFLNELILRR